MKLVTHNRRTTSVTTKNNCVLPIKEQPIGFKQASWQTQQDLSVWEKKNQVKRVNPIFVVTRSNELS